MEGENFTYTGTEGNAAEENAARFDDETGKRLPLRKQ